MWCSVVLLSLQFKSRSPGKRVVRGIGGRVDTRMFGFREGRIDKINGCSWFIHSRPKRCAAAKGNQIWTVSEAHVKAVTLILRKAKATAKANAAAAAPKLKQRSSESSGSCKSPSQRQRHCDCTKRQRSLKGQMHCTKGQRHCTKSKAQNSKGQLINSWP